MKTYQFTVVLERDDDVRSLQGCYTEGETEGEAMELIRDAIRLHIEARRERGESQAQDLWP